MSPVIRIALIDDHALFRESLSRLLQSESDLEVAGSFASVEDACAAIDQEPVDLILLDCDPGAGQGPMLVRRVVEARIGEHILLVTAGVSDEDTVSMLKYGISGIVLKHSPSAQLVEAIHRAVRGEVWLDKTAVRALVAGAAGGGLARQRFGEPLTARERAILAALFEGLTNKEIAAKLRLSENAVKWALQQLFEKTGARVRSQLVRIVLEKYGKDWLTDSSAGGDVLSGNGFPR